MNNTYILYAILTAAIFTYLPRVLPLAVIRTKIKNVYIRSFLTYIPYGVLSAMIFPAVFYSTNSITTAFAGTIIALILSFFNKSLLTVALASVITVLLTEFII